MKFPLVLILWIVLHLESKFSVKKKAEITTFGILNRESEFLQHTALQTLYFILVVA